jgi:hypothetical protein
MPDARRRSDSAASDAGSLRNGDGAAGTPGKQTLTGSLPPSLAAHAGARLGQDFSSVTVHEDGSPERLGTSAYARGDALYFAAGQYQPDTASGVAKIGHELGHVAQQRSGTVQPTGARGGVPVNTDPSLERAADAAGATVAQGFDMKSLFGFRAHGSGGAATGIAQGADLEPDPMAQAAPAGAATTTAPAAASTADAASTATTAAAPAAAPAATPVPPEVLARVGAEFQHTDDTAGRRYRITDGGGFLLTAAPDGAGVGKAEFRQDNKYKDAWATLAKYVVANQASIAPTAAAPASPSPTAPDAAAPASDSTSLAGAVAAVGNAIVGAVQSGVALFSGGMQSIRDAIASIAGPSSAEPGVGATPAPAPGTGAAPAPGTGTGTAPGASPAPATGATPAPGPAPAAPGPAPAPAAPTREPTTTAMVGSVGTGGTNQADDVTLVQDRLGQLGYASAATGSVDDATVRAIGQYQAAMVAHGGSLSSNLVAKVDGLISKGGATEKSLFGSGPFKLTAIESGSVKPNSKDKEAAGAVGEAKTFWDGILGVWAAVSPYLPDGSYLSSGYRSYADQVRVIEDFFTDDYKAQIISAHGQAEWQALVGKTDAASVTTKLGWVRDCGQDVAAPGTSPHQSGHAIDVGGPDDNGQIHALLRYHVDLDKAKVTKIIHEKNGCVHFEFA